MQYTPELQVRVATGAEGACRRFGPTIVPEPGRAVCENLEDVLRVQDLGLWDGSVAFLIDGGSAAPSRPAVHLQAAAGGYLRLVAPKGPVLWGLVDKESYGVSLVRSKTAVIHALPPLRADEVDRAPGVAGSEDFSGWWTRRYAARLIASANTPLAVGRRSLCAPMSLFGARSTPTLVDLVSQQDDFELDWSRIGFLLTRRLSQDTDGRVRMWRKRALEGRLPPVVVWWCHGLFAHVVLDGHDRVHAALLEGVMPDIVVLTDVSAEPRAAVEHQKRTALDAAATLEASPLSAQDLAALSNSVLKAGWDPRARWDRRTPGFPLDGGVAQWTHEVQSTRLALPTLG